jgi:hypothetical protein
MTQLWANLETFPSSAITWVKVKCAPQLGGRRPENGSSPKRHFSFLPVRSPLADPMTFRLQQSRRYRHIRGGVWVPPGRFLLANGFFRAFGYADKWCRCQKDDSSVDVAV